PIKVAEEQERVRQLQGEVGTVRLPRPVVPEATLDEVRPDRLQCQPEREVNVAAELGPVVQPGRVEIGDGPDDRRVQPTIAARAGWHIRLPLPLAALLTEDPPDGRRGIRLQRVESGPQLSGLGCADAFGEPCRLVEPGQAPQVVPVVRLVRVTNVLRAPAAQHYAVGAAGCPGPSARPRAHRASAPWPRTPRPAPGPGRTCRTPTAPRRWRPIPGHLARAGRRRSRRHGPGRSSRCRSETPPGGACRAGSPPGRRRRRGRRPPRWSRGSRTSRRWLVPGGVPRRRRGSGGRPGKTGTAPRGAGPPGAALPACRIRPASCAR